MGESHVQGDTASKLWVPDSDPESRTRGPENDTQEAGLSNWVVCWNGGNWRRNTINSLDLGPWNMQ